MRRDIPAFDLAVVTQESLSAIQRAHGSWPSPLPVRRALRRWILVAGLLGVVWALRPSPGAAASTAPAWDVELSSTGSKPVMALVVGKEAGLHVVRIPASDAS